MNRDEARLEVRMREPDFLPRCRIIGGYYSYACPNPNCTNGSGDSHTGIVLNKKYSYRRYHCFACGLDEDVIGLWKLHTGLTSDADNAEAFSSLYDYYGIVVENTPGYQKPNGNEHTHINIHTSTYTRSYTQQQRDYMDYYGRCAARINETDYPKRRGLSDVIAKRFMLGYDDHFKVEGGEWAALIIPTGRHSFVARNVNPDEKDKGKRFRKRGPSLNYNVRALRDAQMPIFITEGELDALSIIEVGGEAVAMGSTSNCRQLVQRLEKRKPAQTIIVALDNDDEGEKTALELIGELERLGIPYHKANVYGECKDANEALLKDREALAMAVNEWKERCAR